MLISYKAVKENINVLLPPAVGFRLTLLLKLLCTNKVLPKYYLRAFIIIIINLINLPFRLYEKLFINPKIKRLANPAAPIFIIGHWRSGTTHLHNLMCQDPQMGFVTTYQGVFPDTMFNWLGKFIFKNFMILLIPPTRKGDNVKLDSNYPQEEDFIPGMNIPFCYYYFWMFPRRIKEYYKKYVQFKEVSLELTLKWRSEYQLLIKKALKNSHSHIFVSKNPVNTGRIKQILEIFPDARFIHIHRNPIEVFLSTKHFYHQLLPYLQFHDISDKELEEDVLNIYHEMMNQMIQDIPLLSAKNFIELRFEDLERDPMKQLEKIYDHFKLPLKESALSKIKVYLADTKDYKKNKLIIQREQLDKILDFCEFAMNRWNYFIPDHLDIQK
jgi:hypothetical protein